MDDNNPFRPTAYETTPGRSTNANTNVNFPNFDFYPSSNQYTSSNDAWNQPPPASAPPPPPYGFSDSTPPPSAAASNDQLNPEQLAAQASAVINHPVWTWKFWQSFFDVDTSEVLRRIFLSFAPWPRYLKSESIDVFIGAKPDLYGPFWISTTLVFVIAVLGNVASYFQSLGQRLEWRYDFHQVTAAAITVFVYVWIIPLLLWLFLWWRNMHGNLKLTGAFCLYGYSMFLYIPISFIWLINIMWLQWIFALTAACLTGTILAYVFWNHLHYNHRKTAFIVGALVFAAHIALAFGFVGYFFHYSHPDVIPIPSDNSTTILPSVLPPVLNDTAHSSALVAKDVFESKDPISTTMFVVAVISTLPTTTSSISTKHPTQKSNAPMAASSTRVTSTPSTGTTSTTGHQSESSVTTQNRNIISTAASKVRA